MRKERRGIRGRVEMREGRREEEKLKVPKEIHRAESRSNMTGC